MQGWRYRARAIVWAGLLIGWAPGLVFGAEVTVTPSLRVQTTYDDNVYLEGGGDVEYLFVPELDFSRVTEKSRLDAGARVDISEYGRLNEFDSVDQRYDLSASFQPTDLWTFGFDGQYVDDYTFRSALEESGVLADRTRRKTGYVEPFATFMVNPRNTLRGSYSFNNANYEYDRYPDYKVHGVTVTWYHALPSERSRLIFLAGASDATYKQSPSDTEQDTIRGLVGFDHYFTETFFISLLGGAYYTESSFPRTELVAGVPTTRTVEEDNGDFLIDGSVEWKKERYTLSAHVRRDIDHSIYGENVNRDRVDIGGTMRWTERFGGTVEAVYRRSETDGLITDEKNQAYSVRPSVYYRMTEGIRLVLGYGYTWREEEISNDVQERNRVFAAVSTDWPFRWD